MKKPSRLALMKKQKELWPDSVEMRPEDIFWWADKAPSYNHRLSRLRAVAMTTLYPRGIFYRTRPDGGYIGFRYGLGDADYLSSFTNGVELDREEFLPLITHG